MKKASYLATIITLLCHPVAAVELGELTVKSYLNEPLDAELGINYADEPEWADLRFRLAGAGMYERFGLQRPANLNAMQFRLAAGADGRYRVRLTSQQRIVEPILNLLIQVEGHQGDFFKAYSLLIDPPSTSLAAANHIVTDAGVETGLGSQIAQHTPDQSASKGGAGDSPEFIQVRNRSLSIIAEQSDLHQRYSVYQIMRALYLANPGAFEQANINRLRSGSRLKVPAETVIAEVPRQQAVNFVYSVSRDQPSSRPADAVAHAELAGAVAMPIEQPGDQDSSKPDDVTPGKQGGIKAWRSIASEFSSLASSVDSQNTALRSQLEAIRDLYRNMDARHNDILDLSLRLDALETVAGLPQSNDRVSNGPMSAMPTVPDTAIQRPSADGSELTLSDIEEPMPTVVAPEPAVKPVEVASEAADGMPVAPIVTHVPGEQPVARSHWWSTGLLVLALLALGWREWVWRRRQAPVSVSDERRPTTYSPGKQTDTSESLEIRHLEAKAKGKRGPGMSEVGRSALRLESQTLDDVKVEIEVLLAYEQYEEALELLKLSEMKFGEDAWIDYKRLEILAATNQCDEFMRLLDSRRALLEDTAPILWSRAKALRDRLCADLRVSAMG